MLVEVLGWGHLSNGLRSELPRLGIETTTDLGSASVTIHAEEPDPVWCETDTLNAFIVMCLEPVERWKRVRSRGGKFIHVGSGCIWDGPFDSEGRPFGPESTPNPGNTFGWLSATCEFMLRKVSSEGLAILRPRLIYSDSDHERNVLQKFWRFEKLIDVPQSMTSISTIAKTIKCLIQEKLPFDGSPICVYDYGTPTPFEVGQLLFQFGLRESEPKKMQPHERDPDRKRVDVVMHDPRFEEVVSPPWTLQLVRRYSTTLKVS